MEWKSVRKWLIWMLLAVNVLLAGNLVLQITGQQKSERAAVENAVTVALQRGILLDGDTLLQMPALPQSYSGQRSASAEQTSADALLGGGILP